MLCARRYRILVRLERQVPKRKRLFPIDKIMTLRHCVRAAKEMDSKSIGLRPQGFESPRCRLCYYLVVACCFPTLQQQGEASSTVERHGFQDGARLTTYAQCLQASFVPASQAGYSSVGRASDCRDRRSQMVPGSIPGGRIFS